jgi:hypothetical protein
MTEEKKDRQLRIVWLVFLALSVSLLGCSRPTLKASSEPSQQKNSQWILESYDSVKGFTFSKDGVSYLTKCSRIVWVHQPGISNPNGFQMDVYDQNQCVELLPYLHKVVPLGDSSENYDGTLSFATGNKTLILKITEAK